MTTPEQGLRNAAVLLLSLPQERVAELLGRLEARQAAAVSAEMAELGTIDDDEQAAVVCEFAGASVARLAEDRSATVAPFRFLHDLSSDTLLDLIADEQPQVIALILFYLPPRQSAAVLAELPPEVQLSVFCRIATTSETSPEVVRDVECAIQRRLGGATGEPAGNRGVESVVRMLNVMEPASDVWPRRG